MTNDEFAITGDVDFILDKADGTQETYHVKNLVVDAGRSFVINALKASSTTPFAYTAIGTGGTAATTSDTALVSEAARVTNTNTSTSVTVTFTGVFGPGIGTGALQEAGMFNAVSSGTMLSRTVYSTINKAAGDTMTVVWTITLS